MEPQLFSNLIELLTEVRNARLEPGEQLIPIVADPAGTLVGYAVADGPSARRWLIPLRCAKDSTLVSPEAQLSGLAVAQLRALFSTHQGRRTLLEELRSGAFGFARDAVPPTRSMPKRRRGRAEASGRPAQGAAPNRKARRFVQLSLPGF
jgi:hypothetical protein